MTVTKFDDYDAYRSYSHDYPYKNTGLSVFHEKSMVYETGYKLVFAAKIKIFIPMVADFLGGNS